MKIETALLEGRLVRRYKRFLADVETLGGELLTLHCPNTGSMKNCCDPDSRVWFWDSGNPNRKYLHTWEIVEVEGQYLACINTARANGLVVEAIENATISELQGYSQLRTEVKYGAENSRIDVLLSNEDQDCFVEVKNVTLLRGEGQGAFPDAVSARGTKHLRELMHMVDQGQRAVLLFCVAHTGINYVVPADDIDPLYGKTLREAVQAGVEVYAYAAAIDTAPGEESIALVRSLPVRL